MKGRLAMAILVAGCSSARPVDETRRCSSEAACVTVHPPGIADPQSPDFHVRLIVSINYDLEQCQHCHGDDYAGGDAGKSCLKCHDQGPTACNVCHGQPPSTGAHAAHGRFDCSSCHPKPQTWDEPGHLGPLRVSFFDGVNCANTYCHQAATPAWYGGPSQAQCGSCHGNPPPNHGNNRCAECHPTDPQKHVDGAVELGDGSGTCTACHGQPPATGAHGAHASAKHSLAKPIGCGECHLVPTAIQSPGHIDHDRATVFPAGAGTLARSGGAMPAWDGAKCANVYCHQSATPAWSQGDSATECGACHGIPPADAAHPPPIGLGDCHRCHRTVAANGTLDPSTHINGVVDGP
jgi:predicted CxxxxCH...CXXCH cytochrome family protein